MSNTLSIIMSDGQVLEVQELDEHGKRVRTLVGGGYEYQVEDLVAADQIIKADDDADYTIQLSGAEVNHLLEETKLRAENAGYDGDRELWDLASSIHNKLAEAVMQSKA